MHLSTNASVAALRELQRGVAGLTEKLAQPRSRAIIFAGAALVFLAGLVVAVRARPDVWSDLTAWPIVLSLALAIPATILANALEFWLSVRLLGHSVAFSKALEITIAGSAANMLPLPGAVMVRMAALKSMGSSYLHGASATAYSFSIWLSASAVFAGGALYLLQSGLIGPVMVAMGSVGLAFTLYAAARQFGRLRYAIGMALAKTLMLLLDAVRIWLCFAAIGEATQFLQASVLTISAVVGSAVAIVPAGLGIRELVSAAIAPIVALAPAATLLAMSLSRILGFVVVIPLSLVLAGKNVTAARKGRA
ncbi:lysylphosphatidylglycerol synthase domain-containing protein [Nitratireductor sp. XY-223]|uniref:lysylphosphatidylglycerol synthase domain-containing protein n=1 Tax=Nitratireductor sp. XY-223 TaxID=2561926 RepID=UPI0010AAA5F7|nr:lysylphosphatidylglycerol synthase domain-containing protein [Nitratireductor sp. XY-223]